MSTETRLIYTHANMAILHSVKNILELNDIKAFVKNEHCFVMGAEFGINNTSLQLCLCDGNDRERALQIIKEQVEEPPERPAWICSKCQEKNEGSFEICWQCQTEQP